AADEAARAEARAIGERPALAHPAAKASAERTTPSADRVSELEASLPRLSVAETRIMVAPASGQDTGTVAPESVPVFEALRDLPRVASLHRSETGRRR
ncbi:hypothetical protein, partial [Amaricoccus sp.]|uniref:hypothetical protein n=1 Tax=Amaricoccus sp. TaxID=1872485 RepID=UPI002623217F